MKIADITEMAAAGNFRKRIWYHGTSPRNFQKIKAIGIVKPFVADQHDVGAAIWLTSDPEEAYSFGKVLLALNNEIAGKYRLERWSGFPHGMKKKMELTAQDQGAYHMILLDPVPLKYWKILDPKTGLYSKP